MKTIIKKSIKSVMILALIVVSSIKLMAQDQINYLTVRPLSEVVTTSLQPVNNFTKLPIITWGGDLQTILAKQDGIFAANGLNLTLFKEDNFKTQVEMCLRGETPALRGTLAMINSAAELFQQKGTDLIVVYVMTNSSGGDCMVVRPGKTLANITTVGLQLNGPHMDYAPNLFSQVGRLSSVKFKWLQNLTISDRVNGKITDPVTAFQKDPSLDAVMCIIPDGLMLTSGGTVGTGTDNSVKGAKILLSTKTADKIIYDVYAFRKDYYTAHLNEVKSFVKAMFQAEEKLQQYRTSKESKFFLMTGEGAKLFGLPQADVQGMLGDCKFLGYNGNVTFFTGKGTTRNFATLNKEIQPAFKSMGLMKSACVISQANWDYSTLTDGLKNATAVVATPKFDEKKLATVVEKTIAAESNTWEEAGTLFKIEIYFQPNQNDFLAENYAKDFVKAMKIADTYSGAVVVIEGHSDHGGVSKAKQSGTSSAEIKQMTQVAKNLSLDRAENVKKSFLAYAKKQGITMDASQFVAVGLGIENPKYIKPTTKEEWQENFRVVFLIKQMEGESDVFDPSSY